MIYQLLGQKQAQHMCCYYHHHDQQQRACYYIERGGLLVVDDDEGQGGVACREGMMHCIDGSLLSFTIQRKIDHYNTILKALLPLIHFVILKWRRPQVKYNV